MNYPTVRLNGDFDKILAISDIQEPWAHPDAYDFIKKVKDVLQPKLVVQIGDYADFGPFSNFTPEPEGLSAKSELDGVKEKTKIWAKMFPNMYITLGNHEMRLYRKSKEAGLPPQVLKQFNDIVGAPEGWIFVDKLKVNWSDPVKRILFVHTGPGAKTHTPLSVKEHARVVHGHLHSSFWIKYHSTTDALLWDMNIGCLIDGQSPVFNYDKKNILRPILGTGVIIDGQPRLVPMILNRRGRWKGTL